MSQFRYYCRMSGRSAICGQFRYYWSVSVVSCTRSRIRSAIYEPIPVLLSYVGSFCHLWAIPLLLICFGRFLYPVKNMFCHLWANSGTTAVCRVVLPSVGNSVTTDLFRSVRFVAVFANDSNVSCLGLVCKRFVWQEQNITVSQSM